MNAQKQRRQASLVSHMGANQSNEPITGQVPPTLYMTVLTRQQYKELEKKSLQGLSVREETSSIQAGFQLGVEHVLRIIREGFASE